jgi:hypothetical protein
VHAVDRSLVAGLWTQGQVKDIARDGVVADAAPDVIRRGPVKLEPTFDLRKTGGLTVDVWLRLDELTPGQTVLDTRDSAGHGFALVTADKGTLRLDLSDSSTAASWDTDPGLLQPGQWQHVVAIADCGANVISFVVNGVLCDGGEARECGWGRIAGDLRDVSGTRQVRFPPGLRGEVVRLRVYNRPLRTSEAVAHFHAGR